MPRELTDNYLWLLAGLAAFGFGIVKFWQLAVEPQLGKFVGE